MPAQAGKFKGHVVGYLGNRWIPQSRHHILGNLFPLREVHNLGGHAIYAVSEQKNGEGISLYVSVRTTLGYVHIRIGLDVYKQCPHSRHSRIGLDAEQVCRPSCLFVFLMDQILRHPNNLNMSTDILNSSRRGNRTPEKEGNKVCKNLPGSGVVYLTDCPARPRQVCLCLRSLMPRLSWHCREAHRPYSLEDCSGKR